MALALITGGSRGIGKAIVDEFRQQGWEILAPSREELNLADSGSVQAYCETLREKLVDALVNNAGINFLNPLADISPAQWDEMLQVNLTAVRSLIQAVVPSMKARAGGKIVNLSSIFSMVSRENRTAYSVTKAAVNALTRSAAIELGRHGILVNAVCPGYIETDMTHVNNSPADIEAICTNIPLGRLGGAGEIAKLAAFLCGKENTYITGQSIVADGGFTCK